VGQSAIIRLSALFIQTNLCAAPSRALKKTLNLRKKSVSQFRPLSLQRAALGPFLLTNIYPANNGVILAAVRPWP